MTNDQTLKNQIQALMAEVENSRKQNAIVNKGISDEMNTIKSKFDAASSDVDKKLAELDAIEKETTDALDKVILENAEDAESEE